MALEKATFDRVCGVRPADGKVVRMLSLGYPDLLVDEETLRRAGCFLKLADDGDKIAAWHGWKGPVYDTTRALASIGILLESIDIRPSRGAERIVDLNHPQPIAPGEWRELYDVILDPGTLEHCFNIGQAFLNVAAMVAPGGTIIHTNPISMVNHGFYNLSPTVYADFYGQNGFELVYLGAMAGPVGSRVEAPVDPHQRTQLAPEVSSLVVVKAPGDWSGSARLPTQRKYLTNPELKA
jgi:hypothetical protein